MEYALQFLFLLFLGDAWEENEVEYFYLAIAKPEVFWIFNRYVFSAKFPHELTENICFVQVCILSIWLTIGVD